MRRVALALYLLVFPALFAACGGGSADDPADDPDAAPRPVAQQRSVGANAGRSTSASPAPDLAAAHGVARGDTAAPVVVHEFADFQCPACRMAALQFLPYLEGKYIETGKIRYVFIDLPLTRIHANSLPAHLAARCARDQEAFFPYHDRLYEQQHAWSRQEDPTEALISYARDLDLDVASFRACLEERRHEDLVRENRSLAMRLQVPGTPTFYVNGEQVYGAGPEIVRAIDEAVSAASSN